MIIETHTKLSEEDIWRNIRNAMSFVGAYYITMIGDARIYRYIKDGRSVEITVTIHQSGEYTKIKIMLEGDENLMEKVLDALRRYEIISEEIVTEKKFRLEEIRREDIVTKDTYMPYLLPGFYRFYGKILPSLLTISIKNIGDVEKILRVECEIPGYSARDVKTFNINAGEEKVVEFNPQLLHKDINECVEANLRYGIYEDERVVEEQTYKISIYSPLDFMLKFQMDGKTIDFYPLLAAWVTPHAKCVEEIIREASEIKKEICGDGSMGISDTDENVLLQMKVVYEALKRMGIEYINTPVSFAPGVAQRIRYISNVIQSKGGNCIELTIAMASVLEALDIQPLIVIVPAHAFLGVRLPSGRNVYVESTLIPTAEFEEARNVGEREFDEYQKKDEILGIVDIREMREEGILPTEIQEE